MIKMDIRWDKNPKKIIENFQRAFPGELNTVVKETASEATEIIMRATPVKTGQARRNWFIKKVKDSEYEVINEIPYVPTLEDGSKPHLIEGNPYLTFVGTRADGSFGFIRKKSVKHPGTKPHHMIKNAIPPTLLALQTKVKALVERLWSQRS